MVRGGVVLFGGGVVVVVVAHTCHEVLGGQAVAAIEWQHPLNMARQATGCAATSPSKCWSCPGAGHLLKWGCVASR